jgi:glycosidase
MVDHGGILAPPGGGRPAVAAVPTPGGPRREETPGDRHDGVARKVVIYQLVVRTFSNTNETRVCDGTIDQNGCGKFDDIDAVALRALRDLGITHVWLTGVLRQATLTAYDGLPADEPDVVKGRAGSFFAVRDYYDVCPDYANRVEARLEEFDALVGRIHAAGLEVMIDLVPNHVARGYGSVVHPERDFGLDDDTGVFFSPTNDFFYLVEPPHQALNLAKPLHWHPSGVVFGGRYWREDGVGGRTPKATGNNVVSPRPDATDWYETIKLNWGFNFVDGSSAFTPRPPVWEKFDAILAYWQARGVDGFRVDFAHFVPASAWEFLLAQVKHRNPAAYVVAEAYENLEGLLSAGFDAVYDDAGYDLLKRLYLGRASGADVDHHLAGFDDPRRGRYLRYLENHDERRVASPLQRGGSDDASGFGSAHAGRHLAPILFLCSQGPVLLHAGQEVGEEGAGSEGFSGEDGRTSIFDYWSMPAVTRWVNRHAFDGGGLSGQEWALRGWYSDLLALCQDPSVRGRGYWGLRYWNNTETYPDANDALLTFGRFSSRAGRLLVVASNLGGGGEQRGRVRIPAELAAAAGLPAETTVRLVLDGDGARGDTVGTMALSDLVTAGFLAVVGDQRANVYSIE